MRTVIHYRVKARNTRALYVGGRMGAWGQMVDKKHAWRRTMKWWKANLNPGWEHYFKLERVGNGRLASR
jgi:hypothetical protein